IECSETTKEPPKINSLFERAERLSRDLGCQCYPVFATYAKRKAIRDIKDYARVSLLAQEDLLELIEAARRNEPMQKILEVLLDKKKIKTSLVDIDSTFIQKADTQIGIYIDL
ncbi:MAG: hypothetical protein L0209_03810, partial [candidate division Zixibacteria bacterium]|nr:hypothetical protein [candidate division Zixibacteria bacterium]